MGKKMQRMISQLLVLLAVLASTSVLFAQPESVLPLDGLLTEYEQARAAAAPLQSDPNLIAAFRKAWLIRLKDAVQGATHGPSRYRALIKALGIANVLADTDNALFFASQLIQEEQNPGFKWKWREEKANQLISRFGKTRSDSDRELAIELLTSNVDEFDGVVESQDSYRTLHQLLNISSLAALLEKRENTKEQSADLYKRGFELLSSSSNNDAIAAGCDLEHFASSELRCRVSPNANDADAIDSLHRLASLKNRRLEVSAHFRDLVFTSFHRDSEEYNLVIERWYEKLPEDNEKVLLKYELALSYANSDSQRDQARGIKLLEEIRSQHRDNLLAYDAEKLGIDQGTFATSLWLLLLQYASRDNFEKVIEVGEELLSYGISGEREREVRSRMAHAQRELDLVQSWSKPIPSTRNGTFIGLLSVVNGLVIVVFGCVLFARLSRSKGK